MPFDPKEAKQETDQHMRDPQIGDYFSEMATYWIFVCHRYGNRVIYLDCSASFSREVNLLDEGKWHDVSLEDFRKKFSYGGSTPGYWVYYCGNRPDVKEWYELRYITQNNYEGQVRKVIQGL